MKKALYVATVDIHIKTFHLPYLKMLHEMGYEVHVATNGTEQFPNCDKKHQICIERSPFKFKNFKAIKQLKTIIDKENFDIIHCHTPMGSVVTRIAAKQSRKNGTRVIYTAHGFHFYKGAPIINWLLYYPVEKYLAKFTDTLVTINKEDYKLATEKFKKVKVNYIPGIGVDSKKFNIDMSVDDKINFKKQLGLKENDFILIYPARLDKNKNQKLLINVMEIICKQKKNNNIHLILPGKDELNGKYKEIVKKMGLTSNIHFLGLRNDIPKLLKISNVAVASSLREGFGLNLVEALYSNLPIVATKNRGHNEIVIEKINGYLINSKSTENFSECIIELYNNKKEYNRIVENCQKSAEKFNLIKVLEIMKGIYLKNERK